MDEKIVPTEPTPQITPDIVVEAPTPLTQAPEIPIPEVKCWRNEI